MSNGGVIVVISGKDDGSIKKSLDAINADLARTTASAHEAEGAFAQLGERTKKYLEYAGIALAIRGTTEALKGAVSGALELAEAIHRASENTGLAVETLSTLHYAADVTGGDFDAMTKAASRMDLTIARATEGNKQALAFLGQLKTGLSAEQLANAPHGAEIAFRKLATTLADTASAQRRVELASEFFGQRAGAQQIATLIDLGKNWEKYAQGASDAGTMLSGKTLNDLVRTQEELRQLHQQVEGVEIALAEGLTPALESMIHSLTGAESPMAGLRDIARSLGEFFQFAAAGAHVLASGIHGIGAIGAIAGLDAEGAKRQATKAAQSASGAEDVYNDIDAAKAGIDPKDYKAMLAASKKGDLKSLGELGAKLAYTNAFGPYDHNGKDAFPGIGDLAEADKIASAKQAREAAQTRLDEQMAQLRAQIAKGSEEQQLADLEDGHKRALISDQEFYARKLAIEKASFDAQRQAAQDKQADIDKQIASLTSDEKKQGANSSKGIEDQTKILDLRTRRLQIDGEIAKINADGAKAELDYQQQIYDLTIKQMEQTDELAAKREEITGGSVEQRLHQSADNYIVKRDELVANHGEGSQEVSDADFAFANDQSKIRAAGAEQNSNPVIAGINAQRTAVSDAEARGTTTTVAAQQQRIELDREEAQALGPVLAAYEELANAGDLDATQKVIELKSRIAELNDPVDEVSQHMRESFDSAFESLFENLDQGTKGFQGFFKSIEKELERETYKRYLEPLVQQGLGRVFPNKIPGLPGTVGDPGIGGAHIPDPGEASGIGGEAVKAAASIGSSLGIPGLGSAKKGGGDVITIELVNKSGTPLAVGGTDVLSKLFSKDHIISVIKDDFEGGGFMRLIAGGLSAAL